MVIPMRKGADFITFCTDEKPTFHEVKKGYGGLTPAQKALRELAAKIGADYKVDRCARKRQ